MLYQMHDLQRGWMAGMGRLAQMQARMLEAFPSPLGGANPAPVIGSALEVFAHAVEVRGKPAFGLTHTRVNGRDVQVTEVVEAKKPFGQLRHFVHEASAAAPKLLIVAPMSGHYATLLRGGIL